MLRRMDVRRRGVADSLVRLGAGDMYASGVAGSP